MGTGGKFTILCIFNQSKVTFRCNLLYYSSHRDVMGHPYVKKALKNPKNPTKKPTQKSAFRMSLVLDCRKDIGLVLSR